MHANVRIEEEDMNANVEINMNKGTISSAGKHKSRNQKSVNGSTETSQLHSWVMVLDRSTDVTVRKHR
jgi:hypothetical protein